jgi:hypothetical protein
MSGSHEYVRRRSFETGAVDDWSVSADRVALLAGSTVYLVGDDHDQIDLDEPGEHVALNDKLFVFTDGRVEAYGISGARLWGAEVDGVNALAAPGGSDVVVVLTDDERLVGLDAAAGHERFAHDRPDADVATTPEIVCADESLVVAAWSFLSILSPEGETKLRTSLDGAIHGVGVVDDTVVCVMKDDRVLGIDAESGDERWRHDWDVDRIDPFGRDELLVRTGEGVRAVTATGEWTSLDLDDGVPVAAAGGDPVCVVLGSLVNVYGRATEGDGALEASVSGGVVEPTGGSVPVAVENVGETMSVASVAVEAVGATVTTASERLTLAPGESERVRVALSDVTAESIELAVRVNDDLAAEATLPVAGDVSTLDVTASPAAVDEDGWLVDVAVENGADVPIRGVEVSPSGRGTDVLEPDERWSVTVPLPSDEPLVVAAADAERHLEVRVPEQPLVADARFEDGLVVVSVSNDSTASVTDTVELSSPAFPRALELSFEGGEGSRLVAAVPPVTAGEVDVSVESRLLAWTGSVSVPSSAVLGGGGDGRTSAGDRPERQTPEGRPAGGADGEASATQTGDESGDSDSHALELDRRFEPEEAVVGGLQFEYVDVTCSADRPRKATVQTADSPAVSAVVDPGETRSFVRAHTFTGATGEIPSVSVRDEHSRRTARAVDRSPETPDWYCIAGVAATVDGPHLHVEFVNESRTRLSVSDLSLQSLTFETTPGQFEVEPRSTETRTVPLAADRTDGHPALLSFDAGADVSSSTEHQTLVHVPERDRHELARVDVAIDEETVFDEAGGTVVVRLRNDGPTALSDVSAAATGDQVQTMLYETLAVDSLAPDESVKHYVDVSDVEGGLDVPLELGVAGGATEVVELVADAVDDATDVRVDRPSLPDPEEVDVSVPDRISTVFEVENGE